MKRRPLECRDLLVITVTRSSLFAKEASLEPLENKKGRAGPRIKRLVLYVHFSVKTFSLKKNRQIRCYLRVFLVICRTRTTPNAHDFLATRASVCTAQTIAGKLVFVRTALIFLETVIKLVHGGNFSALFVCRWHLTGAKGFCTLKLRSVLRELLFPFQSSELDLPVCSQFGVCNVVDTYGEESWVERQCRCPSSAASGRGRRRSQPHHHGPGGCSAGDSHRDGHTVVDKTKQYKVRN